MGQVSAVQPGQLEELEHVALEAARRAGQLVASTRPGAVRRKSHDMDWVTDVDVAAEQVARDLLDPTGIAFLGEEAGGADPMRQLAWVVDPVDGTVNYVMGIPLVGVNVALVDQGTVLVAATVLPFLGEEYSARSGAGARRNGMPLSVGDGSGPVVCDFRDAGMSRVAAASFRRLGAASVEMAWCAAGRSAAVCYLTSRPWDVAAGMLLIRESGGVVRGRRSGDDPLCDAILAGHPAAVARVVAALGQEH